MFIVGSVPMFAAGNPPVAKSKGEAGLQQLNRLKDAFPTEATALCHKARTEYELGEKSKDMREKSNHFRQAEEFAQQAIKVDPKSGEGYKWLAIALGAQTEDVNVVSQIRLSRRVKENIDKTLSINPVDDIALLVLSRWHYKMASLEPWTRTFVKLIYGGDMPSASLEKAESLLHKAIAIKDRISHRYSLAKVYYRMGRREAALEQLRLALTLPVTFAAESEDIEKARRKLKNWT